MFTPLPTGFPKLQTIVQSIGAVAVTNPPAIEDIGQRLRRAYARAKASDYRSVSAGEIRKLPYAYWLPPEAALPELHPGLVKRYWQESLPAALQRGPRRAKRWLMPLFFTYCASFDSNNMAFLDFARQIVPATGQGEGAFAERLVTIEREVAFFQPAVVPGKLATALLSDNQPLNNSLSSYLLWPGFVDTRLGNAVFEAALEFGEEQFREWGIIARLLDWESRLSTRIVKTHHRVRFADAFLRPWRGRRPPEIVKSRLTEFFIRQYGDPRIEGIRRYQWLNVSPDAIAVLKIWLAGDTLNGFIQVLERTNDKIWLYRQKFWMAYYKAGFVHEAWLALGDDARSEARGLQKDKPGMGFGRLDGGTDRKQSVLLMKIGHRVFTEWSHNGSLRAYEDGHEDTPLLYKESYHRSDLLTPLSMNIHDDQREEPQLRHDNSKTGWWQRQARNFIRRETGVDLDDREILL